MSAFLPDPLAVCRFLEAIEQTVDTAGLFRARRNLVLKDYYIPIQVTLKRIYYHEVETSWGYAEAEAELSRPYASERMAWEEAKKVSPRIIVLADPGMGKSTLLRREASLLAQQERQQLLYSQKTVEAVRFPVILQLSDLAASKGEVIDTIPELIRRDYPDTAPAILPLLQAKLATEDCLLLLDAFDEVPAEQRPGVVGKLNRFVGSSQCQMVCTSRLVGYSGAFVDGAKEMEIVPFDSQQTERYVTTWFTNAADAIEEDSVSPDGLLQDLQTKSQIRSIAQTPLLLSLLCSLYQDKSFSPPVRRSQVYEQVVSYLLDRTGGQYLFLHHSFQAYFTAAHLTRLCQTDLEQGLAVARTHFWDYEWHETLPLLAGLLPDPLPLVQAILEEKDDIFSSLLLLAGRCLAEVGEESQPLTASVIDQIYSLWRSYHGLGFIRSVVIVLGQTHSQTCTRLQEALQDEDYLVRLRAAAVLGEIRSESAVEILMTALQDKKADVRGAAAGALGKSQSEHAVAPLIAALQDQDDHVRASAAGALGKSRSEQAVGALIACFSDEQAFVRRQAAEALGAIGSEATIDALSAALQHADAEVRFQAVNALGVMTSTRAIRALTLALRDEDALVKMQAAWWLGEIGNEYATDALVAILQDQDELVRAGAAKALGAIGGEEAIGALAAALQDQSGEVGRQAAEALRTIGSDSAIVALTRALRDKRRGWAAEALGAIGNKHAIRALTAAFQSKSVAGRVVATRALGKSNSKSKNEHAVAALIVALQDKDAGVRWQAAKALGETGSEQAIDALSATLQDTDIPTRVEAAKALGTTGSEQAVPALIAVLQEKDIGTRVRAVEALGAIGSARAVPALLVALRHKDVGTRVRAAEALGAIGSEQAVGALTDALTDKQVEVRQRAAWALEKMKNEEESEDLIAALQDTNTFVRRQAAWALGESGTLETLESLLRLPNTAIYDPDIFLLARRLAVRFRKEKTPLLPVYPERVGTMA